MNIYILLAIIPVVLAVALIIALIRRNITENRGGGIDIAPAIPAIVVLMIAILVIVPMAQSTQDYLFDDRTGELVIQKNIPQLATQPWDEYADEVKTLVIKDGVTIGSGAFDSLTSLEYVSIGEDVTIGSGAFGVSLKDYNDQVMTEPSGQYVGLGDGDLWLSDPTLFRYTSTYISGFAQGRSATHVVLPAEHDGTAITAVSTSAFNGNAGIVLLLSMPDSKITLFGENSFRQCTSLTEAVLPDSLEIIGRGVFYGCTSLTEAVLPGSLTSVSINAFSGCTSLTEAVLPGSIEEIGADAFYNCRSITSMRLPASLATVSTEAFKGMSGVTDVAFDPGFAATLGETWCPWTFYESDGTTVIDKTAAANLAGKTFQGTAAALVEVAAGTLSLTPQQLQQVQLHTQELQDQPVSFDPLPFQPAVQTQDQEPVSA